MVNGTIKLEKTFMREMSGTMYLTDMENIKTTHTLCRRMEFRQNRKWNTYPCEWNFFDRPV